MPVLSVISIKKINSPQKKVVKLEIKCQFPFSEKGKQDT